MDSEKRIVECSAGGSFSQKPQAIAQTSFNHPILIFSVSPFFQIPAESICQVLSDRSEMAAAVPYPNWLTAPNLHRPSAGFPKHHSAMVLYYTTYNLYFRTSSKLFHATDFPADLL